MWCTGVIIADINGDGWEDIYVLKAQNINKETGGNLLFINQEGKSFIESSKKYRLGLNDRFMAGSFFDMDQDGDLDFTWPVIRIIQRPGMKSILISIKHINPDTALTILLENIDNKYFKDISNSVGLIPENGFGISVITADFNHDDLTDIYVGNDFAEGDFLYINQGNKTFKESLKEHFHHTSFFTMGLDYQDVNNDLLPDLISLDMNPPALEKYKLDSAVLILRFTRQPEPIISTRKLETACKSKTRTSLIVKSGRWTKWLLQTGAGALYWPTLTRMGIKIFYYQRPEKGYSEPEHLYV